MRDERIDDVLGGLGLLGAAAAKVRNALNAAEVTNPRKERVAVGKLDRLNAVVAERFARFCATCVPRTDAGGRELVSVSARFCERCGGSDNERALRELVERCGSARLRRLVVVGGSSSFREDFGAVGRELELRLVDGTVRRTKSEAVRDVEWADVVVVCGATELGHAVSSLYTGDPRARGKLVKTARRGVAAIAEEIARHAERRA